MAVRDGHEGGRWSGRLRLVGVAGAATVLTLGLAAVTPAGPAAADPLPGVTATGNAGVMAPVPLAQAGEFVGWGDNDRGQVDLPADLQGVALRKVVANSDVTLALTAAGRVVGWGYDSARLQAVPSDVESLDVVDIALGRSAAGVVTGTGQVRVWGQSSELRDTALDVPSGLSGVRQLVFPGEASALALTEDGTVVGWGSDAVDDPGLTTPPAGLRATQIAGTSETAYALTEAGTVVGWGRAEGNVLPEETQVPGNVVAVSAVDSPNGGGMALLADGSLVTWNLSPSFELPEVGDEPIAAFGSADGMLVLTEDGIFHPGGRTQGNPSDLTIVTPPESAQDRAVAQFSVGNGHVAMIATAMLRAAAPTVTGTPTVGATLTGTPGTFSAEPDQVTSQWLSGGLPIAGATGTSLTLTADLVGTQISYRSTAVKAGHDSVDSTSTPTDPVTTAAAVTPAKVKSTTVVAKVKVAKKAATVTVTGTVTATASPAGTARVTIAKGKKTIVAKAVKVPASGAVKLVVKKFAKLVAKKTKKGYLGSYKITIDYLGNTAVSPSSGKTTIKIKK